MIDEVWKDILGFDGYQISNLGRVRSCLGTKKSIVWKLITPYIKFKYLVVKLTRAKDQRQYSLHRLLYETFVELIPDGMELDHIDRDSFNNSLDNLRLATRSKNIANQKIRQGKKYKGVRLCKNGKWEARTSFKGKEVTLGRYLTEVEAARVYNEYAIKTFGEYACLNIIDGDIH